MTYVHICLVLMIMVAKFMYSAGGTVKSSYCKKCFYYDHVRFHSHSSNRTK